MKTYGIIHGNEISVINNSIDYLKYVGNNNQKVKVITIYYDPNDAVEMDTITDDEYKQLEEGAYLR